MPRKWRAEKRDEVAKNFDGMHKVENTIQFLDSGGERENDRERENEI